MVGESLPWGLVIPDSKSDPTRVPLTRTTQWMEKGDSMETLLIIIIVLILLGIIPARKRLGNISLLGLLLVIVLFGLLFGWV